MQIASRRRALSDRPRQLVAVQDNALHCGHSRVTASRVDASHLIDQTRRWLLGARFDPSAMAGTSIQSETKNDNSRNDIPKNCKSLVELYLAVDAHAATILGRRFQV
jgi:hypothetical protein